ncbi:MAG: hypothetical protein AVDCRST_MAG57-430 [uncultured Blastococcus sp.]|uniref:Acyl-CoA dehydrogenase n=1 Tax=uncultured Blastococcus sp. TaxID=217144 RepID=A0A6J4HAC2_9ACTN|nr:MAG: hypothetical protein AVDCRST_MAG57-430 [uncultured Blastococcus sp.]
MTTGDPAPEQTQTTRLLDAVAMIADVVQDGAAESDRQGTLADKTVTALREHGFWRMRLCRELGGLELDVSSQVQVLAALAAVDTSSAWCTMVANSAVAALGATMPQPAIERIFASGVPLCSIAAAPAGVAVPDGDGFRVSATWRLASSINHAEWLHAVAFVEGDPSRPLPLAIPAQELDVLDTWNVIGLAGTGSNDVALVDHHLPHELAGRIGNPSHQLRGTRRYDLLALEDLESYEHLAFAVGVASRALDELGTALSHGRGGSATGDREIVQMELGGALVDLQAMQSLARAVYDRADAAAAGDASAWSEQDRHLPRAVATWATRRALEIVQLAFHRSGGAALYRPNIFEKLLRDMSVAATHVMVNDAVLATHALRTIQAHGMDESVRRAG